MEYLFSHLGILLADNGGQGGGQGGGASLIEMAPMILAIVFLFYFFMVRPNQKERSQRQKMLDAVKKNDRVLTVGGIYGVVTNVHHEANEITIKVDESTNTKLRLTLGSIARVLGEESSQEK